MLQALTSLGIYGKRRCLTQIFWEFHQELKQLTQLTWFAMATCGPKLLKNLFAKNPTENELLLRAQDVFSCWSNLEELFFNRVMVPDQVESMLTCLPGKLKTLFFYASNLTQNDIGYLGRSHHIHCMTSLTIQGISLRGMSEELSLIAENAKCLESLTLKNNDLRLHEKISLITKLQRCPTLHTLVLYDNEDMVSTTGYEEIISMVCAIQNLKHFYIFPFNYPPFEIFYKVDVEAVCKAILAMNDRADINLYY